MYYTVFLKYWHFFIFTKKRTIPKKIRK